jgi:hypothetical protein
MRRWARALAIVSAATIVPAAAVAATAVPVRLLQPTFGTVLEPGSIVSLEWAAAGALPSGAEEWEAFLSLDGGRSWSYRITPHLDLDIRRFAWRVPNAPARDARILLRFGDERREVSVELPLRLRIAGRPLPAIDFTASSFRRGEAARPGAAGVSGWVEGSRRGAGLRRVDVFVPRAAVQVGFRPGWLALLEPGVLPRAAVSLHSSAPIRAGPAPRSAERYGSDPPAARRSRDLLLLSRRLNE